MKNKWPKWFPWLMVVIVVLAIIANNKETTTDSGSSNSSSGGSNVSNSIDSTSGGSNYQDTVDETILTAVPSELRSNVFLNRKEKGCCKSLTGDVAVAVVMITDSASRWDDEETTNLKLNLEKHAQDVIAEAKAYQAELSITFHYFNAQLSGDTPADGEWQSTALQSAGLPALFQVHNHLAEKYSAKEAPVLFVFNKDGRAYARSGSVEFVVLFSGSDYKSFQHELSHVFGAKDYYYPQEVKGYAENHFEDSVMNNGVTADSLTAYLIGWTDSVADEAIAFLKDTNSITEAYMKEENAKELFTGYGTREYERGTYTGDLVRGIRHGTGTMRYNDGGWYTGQWDNGSWSGSGTGKYYYESGVYEGAFLNGRCHGSGTMQYANGSWYKGEWDSGSWSGSGTGKYTYKDGSTYEGAYQNGKRHGKGTYTYTNGAVYTGDWVAGSKTGTGTMYYANGGKYTGGWKNDKRSGSGTGKEIYSNGYYEGEFLNGNRHGQGTYHWNNGDSYTGQWSNGSRTGYGTYTYANGTVKKGNWSDGKFLG